mgnify:CR=1 FL=1
MLFRSYLRHDGADWLKVNQFFTEQLGYIAGKLDAVQEGDRTLLDNSMILFCSSMMTGNHDNNQHTHAADTASTRARHPATVFDIAASSASPPLHRTILHCIQTFALP